MFPQVPLTREPTCTPALDPGASGSAFTPADNARPSRSLGHFPDFPWPGSPWLAHSSPLHGDWFPSATGLMLGAFCRAIFPAPFCWPPRAVPLPLPLPVSCPVPAPHSSSRVHTPPGRQQPSGAGTLDPHPFGDRFVLLASLSRPLVFFLLHLIPDPKAWAAQVAGSKTTEQVGK